MTIIDTFQAPFGKMGRSQLIIQSSRYFKAFASHLSALCRKNSLIVTPADLCNHWLHSVVIMVEQVELAHVWIGNITLTIT